MSGGIRGCFRCVFVSGTAQVALKGGRVYAPAVDEPRVRERHDVAYMRGPRVPALYPPPSRRPDSPGVHIIVHGFPFPAHRALPLQLWVV